MTHSYSITISNHMAHSSARNANPKQADEPDSKPGSVRWLYRLIALSSGMFIVTIFAMVAVTMSDPSVETNASMKQFFDRQGLRIIGVEVTAILCLVGVAFALDRRESWNQYQREYAEWEARMQKVSAENVTSSGENDAASGESP